MSERLIKVSDLMDSCYDAAIEEFLHNLVLKHHDKTLIKRFSYMYVLIVDSKSSLIESMNTTQRHELELNKYIIAGYIMPHYITSFNPKVKYIYALEARIPDLEVTLVTLLKQALSPNEFLYILPHKVEDTKPWIKIFKAIEGYDITDIKELAESLDIDKEAIQWDKLYHDWPLKPGDGTNSIRTLVEQKFGMFLEQLMPKLKSIEIIDVKHTCSIIVEFRQTYTQETLSDVIWDQDLVLLLQNIKRITISGFHANIKPDIFRDMECSKCTNFLCDNVTLHYLPKLPECKKLICPNIGLKELPLLPKCKKLNCSGNPLGSLPEFPKCKKLIYYTPRFPLPRVLTAPLIRFPPVAFIKLMELRATKNITKQDIETLCEKISLYINQLLEIETYKVKLSSDYIVLDSKRVRIRGLDEPIQWDSDILIQKDFSIVLETSQDNLLDEELDAIKDSAPKIGLRVPLEINDTQWY